MARKYGIRQPEDDVLKRRRERVQRSPPEAGRQSSIFNCSRRTPL